MRVFVYFSPEALTQVGVTDLESALKSERDSEFIFTDDRGFKTRMTVADGQVFVRNVEDECALSRHTWAMVTHVSLWDDVSDPAMLDRMKSGEHRFQYDDDTCSTRASVLIGMNTACDNAFLEAQIKITAPTWKSAMNMHRRILFGRRPDDPYAKLEAK